MGQALPAKISLFSLVSPFMNFDTTQKVTDIIMFNSRNLGALIVDERPHVKEWDEPQFGIQNIGIEESYGFSVLNEGQAIAVAKNVRVRANEFNPVARAVVNIGSENAVLEMPADLSARAGSASARSASDAFNNPVRLAARVCRVSKLLPHRTRSRARKPPLGAGFPRFRGRS